MKKLSASPAGALQRGQVYDLPDERATPLLEHGYAVAVDEPARSRLPDRLRGRREKTGDGPVTQTPPTPKPLDKYTVDELKAFAGEHGIDLGDATKKADILAVILAVQDADEDD